MIHVSVRFVLPGGGDRAAEVPGDVAVKHLMPGVLRNLELPTIDLDGKPVAYRLDSRALSRALKGDETMAAAGIPQQDRLVLSADISAGAGPSNVSESPRIRRLRGDQELMQELAARTNLISFVSQSPRPNLPPERYIVTFKCKSIANVDRQGNPVYSEHHQVEIYLHNQYPQRWPGMKWLTPIWHPNINHLNGSVCIDAAWWTASRSLDRLVIMLGEMLQYKNYHDDPTKPPFPWDPEAARWSREYRKKHPNIFPVDTRELMRPERVKLNESAAVETRRPGIRLAPDGRGAAASMDAPTQRAVRPAASILPKPAAHSLSIKIKPGTSTGSIQTKSSGTLLKPRPKVRIK
jgi:ubiquitin-protein ligase